MMSQVQDDRTCITGVTSLFWLVVFSWRKFTVFLISVNVVFEFGELFRVFSPLRENMVDCLGWAVGFWGQPWWESSHLMMSGRPPSSHPPGNQHSRQPEHTLNFKIRLERISRIDRVNYIFRGQRFSSQVPLRGAPEIARGVQSFVVRLPNIFA